MRISAAVSLCCLLLTSVFISRPVASQQLPPDSGSQRILPLPEGRLSDFQTQMELLQRLRSLVAASDHPDQQPPTPTETAPTMDAKQLEQLQKALKQLQGQLPPGMTPPDLGSIPKEQLDEAMSNPAVQQQLKQMLEQFSRDGLLPRGDNRSGNSPLPPLPRRPGETPNSPRNNETPRTSPPVPPRDRSTDSSRPPASNGTKSNAPNASEAQTPLPNGQQAPTDSGTDTSQEPGPAAKSWQSLSNAMKRLSEIAQGDKSPSPDDAQSPQDSVESPLADEPSTSGKSKQENPATDSEVKSGSAASEAESEAAAEHRQQSLQTFQDLLERYKNSQQDRIDRDEGAGSEGSAVPEIQPGTGRPQTGRDGGGASEGSSKRVLRRPDRTAPNEPPLNSDRRMSEQGEVFPPVESPQDDRLPRPDRATSDGPGTAPNSAESSSADTESKAVRELPPSVSEFLKQQLRDGFPAPGSPTDPSSQSHGASRNPSPSPPGGSSREGTANTDAGVARKQDVSTNMDIRSELEQRGLRGTLKKLVEKARQESNREQAQAEQQQSGFPANPPATAGNSNVGGTTADTSGFGKSLQDLLGGLDHRMEDLAKDARFRDPAANSRAADDSASQQASPDAGNRQGSWNDSAANFLKELSVAPQAPSVAPASGGGAPSMALETPFAVGSLLVAVLALLAMVSFVMYVMRRPLLKLMSEATGMSGAKQVVRPHEIRSRDDVITAFHQLVLHPKQLVEAWWTHRAAAKTLAAASPLQKEAVQTLAEIYEHARYLPADVELPDDQIQSARAALAQCR